MYKLTWTDLKESLIIFFLKRRTKIVSLFAHLQIVPYDCLKFGPNTFYSQFRSLQAYMDRRTVGRDESYTSPPPSSHLNFSFGSIKKAHECRHKMKFSNPCYQKYF